MSRKRYPSEEEKALFRNSIGHVRPHHDDRAETGQRPPRATPTQRLRQEQEVLEELLSGDIDECELETGEELLFRRAGIQTGLIRRLRRGQISIQAELDLHGLIVPEARQALSGFLHACLDRGVRCVRIIHGKGLSSPQQRPVLKGKVNHWLQQRDEVLAFASARAVEGGTGAVLVLLRRAR